MIKPNNDEVICPNCTHQFRAIPVNIQSELSTLLVENEKLTSVLKQYRQEHANFLAEVSQLKVQLDSEEYTHRQLEKAHRSERDALRAACDKHSDAAMLQDGVLLSQLLESQSECNLLKEKLAALEKQEPVAYFNPQERKPFYWAKPTVINAPLSVSLPPMALYTAAGVKESK